MKNISLLKTIKFNGFKRPKIIVGKRVVIKNLGNIIVSESLLLGVNFSTKQKTIINIGNDGKLEVLKSSICNGCRISISSKAKLKLGHDTSINENTRIMVNSYIEIGDNSIISFDVNILDSDQHKIFIENQEIENTKPIIIGKNVWVGSRATILKGVTIGDGAIIASGSIVTKDVPPKTLVAGNPAKIIKENIRWEK